MTSTLDRLRQLADGKRTSEDLARMVGLTRQRVSALCKRHGIPCAPKPRATEIAAAERVRRVKEMAARGMIAVDMAIAVGMTEKSVRELCNRNGIKFRRKSAPPPKRPARAGITSAAIVTAAPQTVAEWIARNGPPPKFEPGTLDQLLHDTFHAVGKRFQRTSGNGSSWRPYLLNGKAISAVDAIRAANQIRAAKGLPLLSEPRRRAA